jgi:hypothetical protein
VIVSLLEFDVSNAKVRRDLGMSFETDFCGTLRNALADVERFLGETRGIAV